MSKYEELLAKCQQKSDITEGIPFEDLLNIESCRAFQLKDKYYKTSTKNGEKIKIVMIVVRFKTPKKVPRIDDNGNVVTNLLGDTEYVDSYGFQAALDKELAESFIPGKMKPRVGSIYVFCNRNTDPNKPTLAKNTYTRIVCKFDDVDCDEVVDIRQARISQARIERLEKVVNKDMALKYINAGILEEEDVSYLKDKFSIQ